MTMRRLMVALCVTAMSFGVAVSTLPAFAQPAPSKPAPAQPKYDPLPRPETQPKPVPDHAGPGPKPEEIISALTTDINGDATLDRILLTQNEDGDATLWVYLGRDKPGGGTEFHHPIVAKSIVFAGPAFGQQPSLEMSRNGSSLLVRSQNDSIGRTAWNQTLTITWRNSRLVVAGLTYQFQDKLELNQSGGCDVNFLSGRALRNGKPHAEKVAPLELSAFDPDKLPKACEF
jgi:hypothetical protein